MYIYSFKFFFRWIEKYGLKIEESLFNFINVDVLDNLNFERDDFCKSFSAFIKELAPINNSLLKKRLTLKMPNGTTFSSGIRGSQAKLKELLENPNIDWATCRYFELSNDGVPRFPVTIDYGTGVRNDWHYIK